MTTLFKKLHDTKETQIAYEASYYPMESLGPQHHIAWSRLLYMTKEKIVDALIPDNVSLLQTQDGIFAVHWEYNNVPTLAEWQRLPYDWKFSVHFRVSPLIKSHNGRVALLSRL